MSTIAPPPGRVRFSVADFARMQDAGVFGDRHIQLLDGELYEVTKNPPHNVAVTITAQAIRAVLPAGYHVREEKTVEPWSDAAGSGWWPEPDITVLRGIERDYKDRHPGAGDIVFLTEVTDTSVQDRTKKLAGYATAGFPVYWILDINLRQLEVYSAPQGGAYQLPAILGESESVDVVIDGQVVGRIAVADLLP